MVVFAFAAFRPSVNLSSLLLAIRDRIKKEYEIRCEVRDWGDLEGQEEIDLVLVDASPQVRGLQLYDLDKADRLFLLESAQTKVTLSLRGFLQSLSSFHGKQVRMLMHHHSAQENVYQVEADLGHPVFGFVQLDAQAEPDVRQLTQALFQEYYVTRLDGIKQQRIEQILSSLAESAFRQGKAPEAESKEEVAAAGEQGEHDETFYQSAQTFLEEVLESMDTSYAIKSLFFRYIQLRASLGQPLIDIVAELLPMATEPDAYARMYEMYKAELDLAATGLRMRSASRDSAK